jgi:hypothetical protein
MQNINPTDLQRAAHAGDFPLETKSHFPELKATLCKLAIKVIVFENPMNLIQFDSIKNRYSQHTLGTVMLLPDNFPLSPNSKYFRCPL